MKKCCVENCKNNGRLFNINKKKYCGKHYMQMRRHGFILERTKFDRNEIIIHEDFAEIILYDKTNKEENRAIIDLDDIEKCKDIKWNFKKSKIPYVIGTIKNKTIRLHRLIVNYYDYDYDVDHIDGNPFNNRKNNLRIVTRQQNMMNQRKLPKNNTSGYIGVIFNKKIKKYVAEIKISGRGIYLGCFENIEDAIKARKEAEIKYFGENKFANYEN